MPLELRPTWCASDEEVPPGLTLGPWVDESGKPIEDLDGDDWAPGREVRVHRTIGLEGDAGSLRRALELPSTATLGIGVRWYCRVMNVAGTHAGGPGPVPIDSAEHITVAIPATSLSGSVRLETYLVVERPTSVGEVGVAPHGGAIWCDTWKQGIAPTLLLEGDEHRIPVIKLPFSERFPDDESALWSVQVNGGVAPEDVLSSVCTILLNDEVLRRDFKNTFGETDEDLLPGFVIAAIQVDLIRAVTTQLGEDLLDLDSDLADGTVGQIVGDRLREAFGSVEAAVEELADEPQSFDRTLWNRFAPDSWRK